MVVEFLPSDRTFVPICVRVILINDGVAELVEELMITLSESSCPVLNPFLAVADIIGELVVYCRWEFG